MFSSSSSDLYRDLKVLLGLRTDQKLGFRVEVLRTFATACHKDRQFHNLPHEAPLSIRCPFRRVTCPPSGSGFRSFETLLVGSFGNLLYGLGLKAEDKPNIMSVCGQVYL